MSLLVELARRFLSGRRSRLLASTTRAALASVALGVAAMVVAMALLSGYRGELEQKLVEGNAAVMIYPLTPGSAPLGPVVEQLRVLPGVTRARRVIYGSGTVSSPAGGSVSVTVRGVEPARGAAPATPTTAAVPVRIGGELARALGVGPGDALRLAALGFDDGRPRFAYRSLAVAETFHTGFAEFDQSWIELDLDTARALTGDIAGELVEVAVADAGQAGQIAALARQSLGPDYLVTDWRELNHALFAALELQQLALFFLLGLIVVVSTFNVAATLVVLVRERLRDVGVLAALGLDRRRIALLFTAAGLTIGATGGAVGAGAGALAAWLVTTLGLVRFGPEVASIYFVDAVVLRVEVADVAAVLAFTLLVTLVSSLVPALRAARVDPSLALRSE